MLPKTDRSDIFKSLDDEKLDTFAFSQALSVTVMVIMTRGLTQKFVIRWSTIPTLKYKCLLTQYYFCWHRELSRILRWSATRYPSTRRISWMSRWEPNQPVEIFLKIYFQVCEDTPRTVCRDTNVLLPKLICTHYLDDRLIFDTADDQRDDLDWYSHNKYNLAKYIGMLSSQPDHYQTQPWAHQYIRPYD